MALPRITGTFRVMAEPRLKFTNQGKPVFSAFISAGKKRKDSEDYDNFVTTLVLFGGAAEHLATNVTKGSYIVVDGEVYDKTYTQDNVEKQTREINATFGFVAIAPPANTGQGGQQQGQGGQQGGPQGDPFGGAPQGQQQPPQQPYGGQQQHPYGGQPQGQPQGYPPQQNPYGGQQGNPYQQQPDPWGQQPQGGGQNPFG